MNVYLGIKFYADNRNRPAIEQTSQVLVACGAETVICIRRDVENWGELTFSPHTLMTKTFEAIRSCSLVVIDLTEKGVGLGIEAGYAHAHGIPVITIAREGSDISTTLAGISSHVYPFRDIVDLQTFFASLRWSAPPENA